MLLIVWKFADIPRRKEASFDEDRVNWRRRVGCRKLQRRRRRQPSHLCDYAIRTSRHNCKSQKWNGQSSTTWIARTVSEVCLVEFICKLVPETSAYVVARTPPSCAIIMLAMDHNTSFRMLCVSKYTEKVGGSAWQAVFICHSSAAVSRWRTRQINNVLCCRHLLNYNSEQNKPVQRYF